MDPPRGRADEDTVHTPGLSHGTEIWTRLRAALQAEGRPSTVLLAEDPRIPRPGKHSFEDDPRPAPAPAGAQAGVRAGRSLKCAPGTSVSGRCWSPEPCAPALQDGPCTPRTWQPLLPPLCRRGCSEGSGQTTLFLDHFHPEQGVRRNHSAEGVSSPRQGREPGFRSACKALETSTLMGCGRRAPGRVD